tara:strand:+ start:397 stop:1017 length:621 start_codon:yes stop_codon:yes gene_type:complete
LHCEKLWRTHNRAWRQFSPDGAGSFYETCLLFGFPGRDFALSVLYGAELHHEVEVVLLIGKEGKNIPDEDSLSYIACATVGLDLTLRDIQGKLKKAGHPWELSKAFEQSTPLGSFYPYEKNTIDLENLSFSCGVNGEIRQNGNTRDMIFSIKTLIRKLSQWWTLKQGDIVFTGTPSGVGPLIPGDRIEIESPLIGSYSWELLDPVN